VLQNYLETKSTYFGIGNYNEEGFAFIEKGLAITLDTFTKALKHKDLKIIYATDATAGGHDQNYCEFIVRVRDGGQDPMQALISATSLSAEWLNMGNDIGSLALGMQADIVAFDGDLLRDTYAVGRAVFIMRGGKVYENVARGSKTRVPSTSGRSLTYPSSPARTLPKRHLMRVYAIWKPFRSALRWESLPAPATIMARSQPWSKAYRSRSWSRAACKPRRLIAGIVAAPLSTATP
jgi:hypothetical protein